MTETRAKCYDAAVVGAGPAGCSAALALAQNGFEVLLMEKAALPRYKTCGGGLLHRAFKLLPPLPETVIERRFQSVDLNFLGTERGYTITRPEPVVYLTMRDRLDHHLARLAADAGVKLVESCPVKNMVVQDDAVKLIADRENFRARFVIAADGVHSPIAKAAGWQELPSLAPALEHEVYLEEDFARFSQTLRFDFNSIDAGYSWVFPKRNHLSVGILSTRRIETGLPARLADYLKRLGITRIKKIERHGFLIPLAPRPGPLARGRVLLTGDAAGLVDPVMAEGISHAILSGQLAAVALAHCRLDAGRVAAHYQSLLDENILRELRAARFLARLLYHHPRIRDGAFRLGGQKLCEFIAGVVMGERSYREAVKNPSSYLKFLGFRSAH
jgi:geranylgeranyl reductase family protein